MLANYIVWKAAEYDQNIIFCHF